MARTNAERTDGSSVIEKGLGILERAWEVQWALRLICGVLFFDMVMVLHSHRGLWQWSTGDNTLWSDVGGVVIAMVGFSFTVAIVIPAILLVLRQIGWIVLGWLPKFPSAADNRPYQRPLGYVFARDLRKLALEEKDDFLFGLYEAHEQARKGWEHVREQAGTLTAAALLTAFADGALAHRTAGSVGLINAVIEGLAGWAPLAIGVVLLYAGTILKWAWFSEASPQLIYYPPLDRELRNQERKARKLD